MPISYNKSLLEDICIRDKCIIDFDKIEKYGIDVRIDFICNCGDNCNKVFRMINKKGGAYCKKCTKNRTQEKIKQTCLEKYGVEYVSQTQEVIDKIKHKREVKETCLLNQDGENFMKSETPISYNKKLLEKICIRDKCIIDFDKIEKYRIDINIDFICNCGNTCNKVFRMIYLKAGAYCEKCTDNRRIEKCKKTSLVKYGVENPQQLQEVKDKKTKTTLERYGVENSFQYQDFRDKTKQTCIERYGFENASKSQEIKDKIMKTNLLNHNFQHSSQLQEVKDKIKQTNLLNHGVEHTSQTQNFKDKYKQTNLLRHGFENPSQNAEISEKQYKNSFKLKEFKFPNGEILFVQGYEPFLLKNLVELGYVYDDIITKRTEVPEIWYVNNSKKCRYYCDVYISKTNTIYEVKSTWTYKKGIDNIYLKKQACIDAGYIFKLYVYDQKGVKQDKIKIKDDIILLE
jgi:hypothetical protein